MDDVLYFDEACEDFENGVVETYEKIDKLQLETNATKTQIFPFASVRFLQYEFSENDGTKKFFNENELLSYIKDITANLHPSWHQSMISNSLKNYVAAFPKKSQKSVLLKIRQKLSNAFLLDFWI